MCVLWNQALILWQNKSTCGTYVTGSNYASIRESCLSLNTVTALQRPSSGLVHWDLCYLQQHQLWWWITPQQNPDISVWLPDRTPLATHLDGTRLWIRLALLNQAGGRKRSPDFLHVAAVTAAPVRCCLAVSQVGKGGFHHGMNPHTEKWKKQITQDTRRSLETLPLKQQALYSPPSPSLFRSWNMKGQGQHGARTVMYETKQCVFYELKQFVLCR